MSLKDKIINNYDKNAAISLLKMMVETPSITGDENELAIKTAEFMKERGLLVEVQDIGKGRLQTFGKIEGLGKGRSMMLCGHLDTFPPPMDLSEPYKAVIRNGNLFGTGVADMKAGTAAMIMAADAIIRSNICLDGDLLVAAVREEEIGGAGISYLLESGIKADVGIVPESTNLMISTTGAGIAKFNVSTLGKSVHVSTKERGVDAIEKMSKVIDALKRLKFTHKPDPRVPKLPRYSAGTIIGGRGREYDLRGAQNLSDYCSLLVNVRYWKSMSEASIEQDIKGMLEKLSRDDPEFQYELSQGYGLGPFEANTLTRMPKDVDLGSEIVDVVKKNHRFVTKEEVRFWDPSDTVGNDDGANMNDAGIQTITYGPGPRKSEIEEYLNTPMAARWINIDTIHICSKVMALSSFDVCKIK